MRILWQATYDDQTIPVWAKTRKGAEIKVTDHLARKGLRASTLTVTKATTEYSQRVKTNRLPTLQ